jgi:hypothetical protein
MIVCQPKKPVVWLISTLTGACYLLAGMWLYTIIRSPTPSLIALLMACLVLSLLLFFSIRLAVGYHNILADKGYITVHYSLAGKSKTYALAALTGVDEVIIPTFKNKEFRQLIMVFGKDRITVNNQVYTGYDALKAYAYQKKTDTTRKRFKR